MARLKELLLRERNRIERIVKSTQKRLESAPEGTLWLSHNQSGRQFYHYGEKRTYISKENMQLVAELAQKSYDEKILKLAKKRLTQLNRITKDFEDNEFEQIYLSEHPVRQQLITPVEPTWEQQLEKWKAREYEPLGFRENIPVILTEKGERVRSKSEKIIADFFYRNGVEYKYECPLCLRGVGIVYPDFTFLSKKTRKEIYMEHFGRMDDPKYARKAVKKIKSYEENVLYIGEKLLVTFETEQTILSTQQLEKLMKKYIL